jgi:predicted enzyme related to lactoylglutathione lyase
MPRVVHFEVHAGNPDRAIEFYSKLFGWQFTKWTGPEDYWLISTGDPSTPGIDGGLLPRRGEIDGQAIVAFVCTVDVPDVEATVASINRLGGTVVVSTMAIPHVGWLAYAKDPEGNIFGVMEADPDAR